MRLSWAVGDITGKNTQRAAAAGLVMATALLSASGPRRRPCPRPAEFDAVLTGQLLETVRQVEAVVPAGTGNGGRL